jgi:hypothetical protein
LITKVEIQGGPKLDIKYTIYCIPDFGPLCIFWKDEQITGLSNQIATIN